MVGVAVLLFPLNPKCLPEKVGVPVVVLEIIYWLSLGDFESCNCYKSFKSLGPKDSRAFKECWVAGRTFSFARVSKVDCYDEAITPSPTAEVALKVLDLKNSSAWLNLTFLNTEPLLAIVLGLHPSLTLFDTEVNTAAAIGFGVNGCWAQTEFIFL